MIVGHGDDLYRYGDGIKANFSSNIYAPTDNSAVKAHLREYLSLIDAYPEPRPFSLERKLSRKLGLDDCCLMVFSGATDAIYTIAGRLAPHSQAAIVQPTFGEYADALRAKGISPHHASNLEEAIKMVGQAMPSLSGCSSVWLCNPNNPDGRAFSCDDLIEQIGAHPEILFVVDQSYACFTLRPTLPPSAVEECSNLIILHSMTKQYKLPGLRLGYVLACDKWIERLRESVMPWAVNALAVEAGLFICDRDHLELSFDLPALLGEANHLRATLIGMGLEVEPTDTHFMLCTIPSSWSLTSAELKERLAREYRLLIRDASNFVGLDNRHIRIATQSAESNTLLIKALGSIVQSLNL